MRNPWRMQDGPDNKINRNNFPMSFQYNGTFKYGKIYPIGLIRTIPGASYQIDSTLALSFMPTSFPIQTRQRAYVHFFYGRDRNFWKDYKDFVNGMNPELVKPYLDESVTQARTGNLLDYLGVPTTIVGSYGTDLAQPFPTYSNATSNSTYPVLLNASNNKLLLTDDGTIKFSTVDALKAQFNSIVGKRIAQSTSSFGVSGQYELTYYNLVSSTSQRIKSGDIVSINMPSFSVQPSLTSDVSGDIYNYDSPTPRTSVDLSNFVVLAQVRDSVVYSINFFTNENNILFFDCSTIKDDILDTDDLFVLQLVELPIRYKNSAGNFTTKNISIIKKNSLNDSNFFHEIRFTRSSNSEVHDITQATSPYWGSLAPDSRKRIKLSAIPCRMYETIYNLYYRNPQNNPYILNGKPEYNVFIPTKDGGLDDNLYELRYRNWEDDFLTTAVQTPQQGIAPLVGLTDRGATVTLTNEDGSVTRYVTNLDENGNVTGIETTDSSEPLLTQALIDAVSYGISIEDLRNVNAMQKWLELNLRKGYQYKDIIEARWGISISYNELDLPEFIGGFSPEVGLQAVTQTTSHGDTIEGALGWQAGRMYASGSGRSITHYCEEEGYIMALLTIVPVPNYSQLLPKHWFTRDLLDSYQPEFNHIGFQPITYKEVCPIQAFQESTQNVDVLEQTFGYQRPWYEYFNQVDEVHGQFRTTFKDFLINRTFDVKPELSESFLLVNPNQVNDVFAVTTDDDKIIGAIEHRIVAKLPISLYAQARLE